MYFCKNGCLILTFILTRQSVLFYHRGVFTRLVPLKGFEIQDKYSFFFEYYPKSQFVLKFEGNNLSNSPRLLSDNRSCYISSELTEYIENNGMSHIYSTPHTSWPSILHLISNILKNSALNCDR